MFKALMKVQWKATRAAVLVASILGFAVPLYSVRRLVGSEAAGRLTPADIVALMQSAGVLYALLSGATGLAIAFFAWSADHRGRHVYALSLPVSRARYALMRLSAGCAFLAAPVTAVLLGSLVAMNRASIPAGLHAYPLQLTLRFMLACLVAFAIFFAITAASQKAAATVLGAIAGVFLLTMAAGAMGRADIAEKAAEFIFFAPGVLSVFTGRWMLIDV